MKKAQKKKPVNSTISCEFTLRKRQFHFLCTNETSYAFDSELYFFRPMFRVLANLSPRLFKNFFLCTIPYGIHLLVVSKKTSQYLNGTYRKKKYPTDILSFSYPLFKPTISLVDYHLFGELYLSFACALENRKIFFTTIQGECERLVIHGGAHLFGYDHEKNSYQKKVMEAFEKKVRNSLNRKTYYPFVVSEVRN